MGFIGVSDVTSHLADREELIATLANITRQCSTGQLLRLRGQVAHRLGAKDRVTPRPALLGRMM